MKIFVIDDIESAKTCRQLLRLSAESEKLQWSNSIHDIPQEVQLSLETLQFFIEDRLSEVCNEKTMIGSLSEDEESILIAAISKSELLKNTIGTGVVLAGEELEKTREELIKLTSLKILMEALQKNKNLIIL